MATETAPSHQTPTSDHESIEKKVTEELKPVEPETISLAKKTEEEEDLKPNEVATQSTAKSEEVEDKEAEPPAVEVKKIDDVPVDDKKELEKDSISDSHTPSIPNPVADVVNGKPVAPAIDSVPKEAEEQELLTSMEEMQREQPKMVDVPVSSDEAIEKPQEQSEVLPIKESEPTEAKDTEDSAVSKEVDKPESVIPEAEGKPKEQSEVGKQVEEPKTEEAVEKSEELLEVHPIKSEPVVVKDTEDSESVSKGDGKPESKSIVPEVEVKTEEQSKVIKEVEPGEKSVEVIAETQEPVEVLPSKESAAFQVKDVNGSQELSKGADKVEAVVPEPREVKLESEVTDVEKTKEKFVEATEKTQDSSEVHLIKESEAVVVQDIDVPVAVPEVDKPESVVPEVEVKQEEQSEVTEQVGKPESVVPEVEMKLEEQPDVTKQAEKLDELEVKVKPEGQSEVGEQVEIKPTDEKPGQVAAITQEAQAEILEDGGKSSSPEIVEKAGPEDEKKEAQGTDLVEVSSKEVVEVEKGGEEKEAETAKAEGEKMASDTLKEEPAQLIKVENVSNAVSNAEVTEKSFEGEKAFKSAEPAVENKKEEIPAIDETKKDGNKEGKLNEATAIISEPVTESQDSVFEAKEEEETPKNNEENSEQEKVDEIAKSDAQNLESFAKDSEDTKVSQDRPREVPAKPTHKQSNNILTKVKHSLVKAKKAIIGKSPAPKTVSSDTKGDVKVNN
ncbi:unnamed protein product [Dovyalis caffra]|uniref:Uncharacterized protein n=1 Tax=Dovyalis caffra TaxID=77055 RepID=A0AAV1RY13_9ROSI|nr:unnamed protein product [Dovyalis caffra]